MEPLPPLAPPPAAPGAGLRITSSRHDRPGTAHGMAVRLAAALLLLSLMVGLVVVILALRP